MIRITFLLRRKPNLSPEEFYEYWLNEHGPLVSSVARDIGAMRYVQVHTLAGPANEAMAEARGGMETPYDGVAEVWFESREAMVEAMASERGRRAGAALLEDEDKFIDLAQSPLWLATEYPQVNPTPENIVARPRASVVKLYFPVRASEELTEDEAQRYWYSCHGPLIRRQAAGSGILRYIQVHRSHDELDEALRSSRGVVVDGYMGHAELWFDRARQGASPESQEANRRAIEDESKFIDFKRSCMWLAKEHVFVDHR